MPEPGRRSAHVLIDAVIALDLDSDETVNTSAVNLALAGINDIDGAITVIQTNVDSINLDVSNLLDGTLHSLHWLVSSLAAARGVEREAVVAELREFIDQLAAPDA